MKLPDLKDTERMARVGRLSILKSERRKAAERLRDSLIPIINGTGDGFVIDAAREAIDDIEKIDTLISAEG